MVWQFQRGTKFYNVPGPWFLFIEYCLIPDRTLTGKRRKTEKDALWPLKLQLNHRNDHASSSCPYTEEKIQDKISSLGEGWRSGALTTRGRAKDNHLIPSPKTAVTYTGFQSGEPLVTWLLHCWHNVAHCMKLNGKEAKLLGFLSWNVGIDKDIGKRTVHYHLESWTKRTWSLLQSQQKWDPCILLEGLKPPLKCLAPKPSSSWHPSYQCWAECRKGQSLTHIMPLMLCKVDCTDQTTNSNRKIQLPWDPGAHHGLAQKWKFQSIWLPDKAKEKMTHGEEGLSTT